MRPSLRRECRALVRDAARMAAADGASGRALALAVEAACPYERDDRSRRRAWQDARRECVGRLRFRERMAREWAGVMGFSSEGGEG